MYHRCNVNLLSFSNYITLNDNFNWQTISYNYLLQFQNITYITVTLTELTNEINCSLKQQGYLL